MIEREIDIERKLATWCKTKGILFFKNSVEGRAGFPDRCAMIHGRSFFLELKAKGKRLRPNQLKWIATLRAHGFHADWVDNFEDGKRMLTEALLDR